MLLGVILAGGQSSRMGLDKATLPIAGTTLLEYMRAKLLQTGIDEIVICRNAPGYLNDDITQLGPLGALYTLSQRYPGRQALIIPVDMPLLSEVTLQHFQAAALASEAIDSQSQSPATLGQQIFPLYLPFTPTVNEALSQRVNQPDDLSIAALLRETGVRRLSDLAHKAGNDEFLNANTPQQWQTILSKVETQSSTAK
jgi:molybdopterin-guanine dinucleotide biosynthesis protein A